MGFLDKIKKSIELKQRMPDDESVEKAENKIIKLKKKFGIVFWIEGFSGSGKSALSKSIFKFISKKNKK